jgi:hypothetical protein
MDTSPPLNSTHRFVEARCVGPAMGELCAFQTAPRARAARPYTLRASASPRKRANSAFRGGINLRSPHAAKRERVGVRTL